MDSDVVDQAAADGSRTWFCSQGWRDIARPGDWGVSWGEDEDNES